MNDLKRLLMPEQSSELKASLKVAKDMVITYKNTLSNQWRVTQKSFKKTEDIIKEIEKLEKKIAEIEGNVTGN